MSSTPSNVIAAEPAASFVNGPDTVARVAHEFAEALRSEGNIRVVFGAPMTLDKHKIIPVARVEIGFGGGFKSGGGNGIAEKVSSFAQWLRRGFGAAGGGGIKVHPVGFIHEEGDHVQYQAIVEGGPNNDAYRQDRRRRM